MHGKEAKPVADPKVLPGLVMFSLITHGRFPLAKHEQLVVRRAKRAVAGKRVGLYNDVL